MSNTSVTDLTQRPPRSARANLGGFVLLPRMLDKGRATIAGKNGDYKYNCPLDQQFTTFAGIDAEAMLEQLRQGKGDGEILTWVHETATQKRAPWEIQHWSCYMNSRTPTDVETREFFSGLHKAAGENREDIGTWADLLDLDDYVSYGGKA